MTVSFLQLGVAGALVKGQRPDEAAEFFTALPDKALRGDSDRVLHWEHRSHGGALQKHRVGGFRGAAAAAASASAWGAEDCVSIYRA